MKEIIFWFSSHKIRNYWFDYAINDLKKYTAFKRDDKIISTRNIKYNKLESWIEFPNLKISFKVNIRGDKDLIGLWDKNQYWVENLFDNNFEEFFYDFIFDSKLF